jgi:hypothetical protein
LIHCHWTMYAVLLYCILYLILSYLLQVFNHLFGITCHIFTYYYMSTHHYNQPYMWIQEYTTVKLYANKLFRVRWKIASLFSKDRSPSRHRRTTIKLIFVRFCKCGCSISELDLEGAKRNRRASFRSGSLDVVFQCVFFIDCIAQDFTLELRR